MDPVSAIGLAGTILSFVTFAVKLVSKVSEVQNSATGPEEIVTARLIYDQLRLFSSTLAASLAETSQIPNSVHDASHNETTPDMSSGGNSVNSRLSSSSLNDMEQYSKKLEKLESLCLLYGLQHQTDVGYNKALLAKLEARDVVPRGGSFTEQGVEEIRNRMAGLSLKFVDIEKQSKVVRSLSFEMQSARHERIPEAHSRTFGWAFTNHADLGGSRLGEWLRTGQGIFWVTGKPGVGKSTFMKFIAGHEETCTPTQKSLKRLLQSLLFDVFRQQPELVEKLCKQRWKVPDHVMDPWTLTELRDLMAQLGQTENMPFKPCFFIDGLDEYHGDHMEFVQDLLNLSKSPNMKVCAASRPWKVFEDAFGNGEIPKLSINDLTKGDIRNYSTSFLCEHPRWNYLSTRTTNAEALIDEIVERSQGVFLWVFLAVRMLRDGLTNDDSFSDLLRRLTLTPVDLEEFFKQMLSTVERFYDEKMAGSLRMAISARAPLDLLVYSFYDQECDDEGYALKMPCRILSSDEKHALRVQAIRRINGYTRGLLQAHGSKVDFLHRTVADFLQGREMVDFLKSKSALGFSPEISLLKARYITCQFDSARGTMPMMENCTLAWRKRQPMQPLYLKPASEKQQSRTGFLIAWSPS
ncbi:hypothetical protein PG996_011239 [Apiospora saccharicola]|uniref:NACHT domain-containing protein n=1 Tax=Apiospora saccharicola TaxID=335842 RepID=A0ABR1UEG7_9PEZI